MLSIPIIINIALPRRVLDGEKSKSQNVYSWTTFVIFGLVTAFISWRLTVILKNIRRAFGGEFYRETLWLRLSMVTFVAAYVLRLIVQALTIYEIMPDIYYTIDLNPAQALLYVFQFAIYNHIPIGIIL